MTATARPTALDIDRLQVEYGRAELACDDAAQAERAAFDRWQAAVGAFEVARDESDAAWRAHRGAMAAWPPRGPGRPPIRPDPGPLPRPTRTHRRPLMNTRQRREAARFTAGGGTIQPYTLADRLRPAWARLRGRAVPAGDRGGAVPGYGRGPG